MTTPDHLALFVFGTEDFGRLKGQAPNQKASTGSLTRSIRCNVFGKSETALSQLVRQTEMQIQICRRGESHEVSVAKSVQDLTRRNLYCAANE